jgi:hydroxymethylglutaryl-CoA synthase
MLKRVGILAFGSYISPGRVSLELIAQVRGHDYSKILESLGVLEKSCALPNEDTITLATESTRQVCVQLDALDINKKNIGAIYVASESHPYAVKPTSVTVGAALDLDEKLMAADIEFACKGGTAALQICMGLVGCKMVPIAMAVGADVAQASQGDILEYTAGAGSASFAIASQDFPLCAIIEKTISVTSDTPDFWRREGQRYPVHTGRFTAQPSYFYHTLEAGKFLLEECGLTPKDINYIVFHQPNGNFPLKAASMLGFKKSQVLTGLLSPKIGNTYSASSLLGLIAVLESASPTELILLVSYGSGSGSDAFLFSVTDQIKKTRQYGKSISYYLSHTQKILVDTEKNL